MIIKEIIYFILILVFGWSIISCIIDKITIEEHLGLSILLGFGMHSLFFYIFVIWLRVFDTRSLVFLIPETIIFVLISSTIKKRAKHVKIADSHKKFTWLKTLLIVVSSLALFYTFVQCVYWPVYEPDALYLYDFRAQRLMQGDLSTFFNGESFYQNGLYPPFTSLMHFFLYQTGFSNPRIFYFVIYLSLYLVIVGYVKRITHSNLLGIFAGTVTIITPSVLWTSILAEPNITLMAFLSLSVLYLFEADGNGNNFFWSRSILGALLLGLSAWTRSEPFWLIPALLVIVKNIIKIKFKTVIIFCAILIPIVYLWPISLRQQIPLGKIDKSGGITQQISTHSIFALTPGYVVGVQYNAMFHYDPVIVKQILQYFFNSFYQSWGLLLPLFLIVVICEIVIFKHFFNWMQFVTISLTLTLIVSVINFAYRFPQWMTLVDSVYRMAIITVPLYWVTVITSKIWYKLKIFSRIRR